MLNLFGRRKRLYSRLTLENLRSKMIENNFSKAFVSDLNAVLRERKNKTGEKEFQKSLHNLHYSLPKEFQDENTALKFYLKHREWVEKEINNLEHEIKLTWETQAEDLQSPDDRVKKVQLVVRQRISDTVMEVLD